MCLLAALIRQVPGVPLVVLANRDERRDRPASPPSVHQDRPDAMPWLGGTDLKAGGTWLGINARGLVVAITNRRVKTPDVLPRSRGLLCRDLLQCESAQAALDEALARIAGDTYDGFNLFLADAASAILLECASEPIVKILEPGIHAVGNGPLNDPNDPRLGVVRDEVAAIARDSRTVDELLRGAGRLCGTTGESDALSICRTRPEWGTVSSTLIALAGDVRDSRFLSSPGPPHEFAYQDNSPLLREMLSAGSDSRTAVSKSVEAKRAAHRIRLKGPWEFVWTPRHSSEEPLRGTVQLPHDWSALTGLSNGSLRLTRRFHKPTNLGIERVSIVIEGLAQPVKLSLDGEPVGHTETLAASGQQGERRMLRADITDRLRHANEIGVQIDVTGPLPIPPWEQACLEITGD